MKTNKFLEKVRLSVASFFVKNFRVKKEPKNTATPFGVMAGTAKYGSDLADPFGEKWNSEGK